MLASAYRHRVPLTVHPGIGYDMIVNHPLYHGAAIGRAATTDVRVFAAAVDRLDGGVYLSVGSAIMSPQVFEKAFSAVNNIRKAERRPLLTDHYLAIVDLQDGGGWDWSPVNRRAINPAYYLRFCKSFYRMGGTLDYVRCDNRVFLRQLLRWLGIDPSNHDPAHSNGNRTMKIFGGMTLARLQKSWTLPRLRIAVIGDFFLDKYLDVDPALAEVSVETRQDGPPGRGDPSQPGRGGHGRPEPCLPAGGRMHAVGLTGDDGESYDLRKDLAALGCRHGTSPLRSAADDAHLSETSRHGQSEPGRRT